MMSNIIGSNIRRIRIEHGWTIDQLADELAMHGQIYTANAIGAWERGERTPKPEVILDLCFVLGTTVYSLYYSPDSAPEHRAVNDIVNLDRRHIETILYLAEKWMGHTEPLIELDRGYAIMTPAMRIRVVEAYLDILEEAIRTGQTTDDLDVDIDMIRAALDNLRNK